MYYEPLVEYVKMKAHIGPAFTIVWASELNNYVYKIQFYQQI